jgi:hypothetical protein
MAGKQRLTSKAGGQKFTLGITLVLLNWVVVGSWGVNEEYQVSIGSRCKAEEVLVSEKLQAQMIITWTLPPPCINWHL